MSFSTDFKRGVYIGRRIGRERQGGVLSDGIGGSGPPASRQAYELIRRSLLTKMYDGPMTRGIEWGIRVGDNFGLMVFSAICVLGFVAFWLWRR
jgi:hypothetical protein